MARWYRNCPHANQCSRQPRATNKIATPALDSKEKGTLGNQIGYYSLFRSDQSSDRPTDELVGDRLWYNQHRRFAGLNLGYGRGSGRVPSPSMKETGCWDFPIVYEVRKSPRTPLTFFSTPADDFLRWRPQDKK